MSEFSCSNTLFVVGDNLGDHYWALSACSYIQNILNKKFYWLARNQSPFHKMANAHIRGGADINLIINDEYWYAAFKAEKMQIDGTCFDEILPFSYSLIEKKYPFFLCPSSRADVRKNLTRPVFEQGKAKQFFQSLHVAKERVAFIIPDSNWNNSMHIVFWRDLIRIVESIGYKVIVNSKSPHVYGPNVVGCMPDMDIIVPLSNLFDILIGMQCGLTEILCAESQLPVTVITNATAKIENRYPFIQPGKINYWRNKNFRGMGFALFDNFLENIQKGYDSYSSYVVKHASLPHLMLRPKDMKCFRDAYREQAFDNKCLGEVAKFCDIEYCLSLENSMLDFHYTISPDKNYEIYLKLIDMEHNEDVDIIYNLKVNHVLFNIPKTGIYKIFGKIIDQETNQACRFSTHRFIIDLSSSRDLKECDDIYMYIYLLKKLLSKTIILIVSKDAHTNEHESKDLKLEILGLKQDLVNKFRYSYLAIIDGGKIVVELNSADKEIQSEYETNSTHINLSSCGFNVYKKADVSVSINIDGKELAINGRGLNFVVVDKTNGQILDSVAFDTYRSDCVARRTTL